MKTELKKYIKDKMKGKDCLYLQVPKSKVGMLGGTVTLGFIGVVQYSFDPKPRFYVCRSLRDICRSFQWHVCYRDAVNKKSDDNTKVFEFKSLDAAINKLASFS
jgi:hypothetical protein